MALNERNREVLNGLIEAFEDALADGQKLNARMACETLGFSQYEYGYATTRARKENSPLLAKFEKLQAKMGMVRRLPGSEKLCGGQQAKAAKMEPDEPELLVLPVESIIEAAAAPEPEIRARKTVKTYVQIYDDVQLIAIERGLSEHAACEKLGYDFEAYISAKKKVDAEARRDVETRKSTVRPDLAEKAAVWETAVTRGMKAAMGQKDESVPEVPADLRALNAVIMALAPLPSDERRRVLQSSALFLGVNLREEPSTSH